VASQVTFGRQAQQGARQRLRNDLGCTPRSTTSPAAGRSASSRRRSPISPWSTPSPTSSPTIAGPRIGTRRRSWAKCSPRRRA